MNVNQFTSVEGITVLAGLLANVIVILAGMRKDDLTPRQKVGIGSLSAMVIFGAGIVLSPNAYPDGPNQAFSVLVGAIVATLTAAGIPVYAETASGVRQQRRDRRGATDSTETAAPASGDELAKVRTWGVWSRPK